MISDPLRVFLDADVLAAPLTRTLLLVGAARRGARFVPQWSLATEAEADRALRPGQTLVSQIRQQYDWGTGVLVPDATQEVMSALVDTSLGDRHVLAAATAVGITVVVTRNVHDFGHTDLHNAQACAVHPDMFMSHMATITGYRDVLEAMAESRQRPPNTASALHAAIGAGHPRLFTAMREAYPGVEPSVSPHAPPVELFRGAKCLLCDTLLNDPESLSLGLCPQCHREP